MTAQATARTSRDSDGHAWLDYWRGSRNVSERVLHENAKFFLERIARHMPLGPEDDVLDIGCGTGSMSMLLLGQVRRFTGLDISERFVDLCRERTAGHDDADFHLLPSDDYTNLSVVEGRTFSRIICNSVCQYYRRTAEIGDLLAAVKPLAAPGATMIISDLPSSASLLPDTFASLLFAARRGFLLTMLRHLARSYRSGYPVGGEVKLLQPSPDELRALLEAAGLQGRILDDRLTINRTRRHVLIQF